MVYHIGPRSTKQTLGHTHTHSAGQAAPGRAARGAEGRGRAGPRGARGPGARGDADPAAELGGDADDHLYKKPFY